jgi:hypothetical protein
MSGHARFNNIKQCRRIATRYDKLAANDLAFVKPAASASGCALLSPRPKWRPPLTIRSSFSPK